MIYIILYFCGAIITTVIFHVWADMPNYPLEEDWEGTDYKSNETAYASLGLFWPIFLLYGSLRGIAHIYTKLTIYLAMKTEIWVDGSFTNNTPTWAYLVKQDGSEVHRASGELNNPDEIKHHQVSGEIAAAQKAVLWCKQTGVNKVTIHYDYEGIRSWAIGAWRANNLVTKAYANFMQKLDDIEIEFVKVKAHSGVPENNAVDKMAKLHSAVVIQDTSIGFNLTYKGASYVIDLTTNKVICL